MIDDGVEEAELNSHDQERKSKRSIESLTQQPKFDSFDQFIDDNSSGDGDGNDKNLHDESSGDMHIDLHEINSNNNTTSISNNNTISISNENTISISNKIFSQFQYLINLHDKNEKNHSKVIQPKNESQFNKNENEFTSQNILTKLTTQSKRLHHEITSQSSILADDKLIESKKLDENVIDDNNNVKIDDNNHVKNEINNHVKNEISLHGNPSDDVRNLHVKELNCEVIRRKGSVFVQIFASDNDNAINDFINDCKSY